MTTAKACGKIILFGEHAVVYGKSGIAVPIKDLSTQVLVEPFCLLSVSYDRILEEDQKLKTENLIEFLLKKLKIKSNIKINISSTIPISSGLGSSASLCVALIRAFSNYFVLNLKIEKVNEIAFECEKIFHGTPSGIDNTVISYEKPVFFTKGNKEILNVKTPMNIIIANIGLRISTKEVVLGVRDRYNQNKEKYSKIFNEINQISINAKICIENGDIKKLGKLMILNQNLLREIEVSLSKLDLLCEVALANGAYGAKLAGAGKGGNMIILTSVENKDNLIKSIEPLVKWSYYTIIK